MNEDKWIEVCGEEDIDEEDVIPFDYEQRTFAIYRTAENEYYATDGYCTHQQFHLSDGLVMGDIIECPKHNGQFNLKTGQAKRIPVCEDLKTYPVKIEIGKVFINLA